MTQIPNYNLLDGAPKDDRSYLTRAFVSLREFSKYIGRDRHRLALAFIFIIINSVAGVLTPYYISKAIDGFVSTKNINGLLQIIYILASLYLVTVVAGYIQGRVMGGVSQRTLFRLRDAIFSKLQALPIAFFNQNKAGDLMSRINNDTDKLSQFLSETVARFVGMFFVIIGIGVFIFFLHWQLALVTLASTVFLAIITRVLSPWIEKQNEASLKSLGLFSSSVQENLANFKVVIAFNRRNYFEQSLQDANKTNYKASFRVAIANHLFEPLYDFAGNIAQGAVLIFGIYFIFQGNLTIGLLIGFLSYTIKFYDPLRTLATIFGNIQVAMASWGRVRNLLNLKSYLTLIPKTAHDISPVNEDLLSPVIVFDRVSFSYENERIVDDEMLMETRVEPAHMVIDNASLVFEQGKTYALVGPTGGGKTTISNIMARLYDPTSGTVLFFGRDIRTYTSEELGKKIGVILQEPFLFTGTVGENIRYGNDTASTMSDDELSTLIRDKGLSALLDRFEKGLATPVNDTAENISIGQKQLIAFIRILIREPELLILDEATANIDTVTEAALNSIIEGLPDTTTKVIIAHRLNTIKKADEIVFVNGGKVETAMDFDAAISMIKSSVRQS